MFDNTSIAHGIISFIVPFAWAIILYPYCRLFHKDWEKMLFFVVGLSLVSMVAKEYFDSGVSVNDIVADILGIFFGTALLALFFRLKDKNLSKNVFVSVFQQEFSLHGMLMIAQKIEERASVFYEEAGGIADFTPLKDLFKEISMEKRERYHGITAIINKWLPKEPNKDFYLWVEKEFRKHYTFAEHFCSADRSVDILKYAIKQEKNMKEFYRAFKQIFPRKWGRSYVQWLVKGETQQGKSLSRMLSKISR